MNQLSRERTCCSGCPGVFSPDLCHQHNLNLPGLLSYHLQLLFVFFYFVSVSSCCRNHCLFRRLASPSLPGGPFCPHRSWGCSFRFSFHCFALLISQIKILRRIRLAQLIFNPQRPGQKQCPGVPPNSPNSSREQLADAVGDSWVTKLASTKHAC